MTEGSGYHPDHPRVGDRPDPSAEVLRTDDPAVSEALDAVRSCATCRFWSRWLPRTGDCMRYALQRRDAMIAAADMAEFHAAWPSKAARATSDNETCAGWEASTR